MGTVRLSTNQVATLFGFPFGALHAHRSQGRLPRPKGKGYRPEDIDALAEAIVKNLKPWEVAALEHLEKKELKNE
jgi:hypothetical protein